MVPGPSVLPWIKFAYSRSCEYQGTGISFAGRRCRLCASRSTVYSREEREGRMLRGNLEVKMHKFTAREYRAMGEDDRVELVDGEIVDMAPIGSRHLSFVVALTHLLVEQAQGR
jgi:hypothetical protein